MYLLTDSLRRSICQLYLFGSASQGTEEQKCPSIIYVAGAAEEESEEVAILMIASN